MKQHKFSFHSWIIFPLALVLLGVNLISTLVLMLEHTRHAVHDIIEKMKIVIISLLALLLLILIVGSYIVLQLIRGLQLQESFLRASLIKHKETIQQAERKNMNKSLAFASASHDVRTSLAGITGLIDLCRHDAPPNSELDRNLSQMSICASKLLGILNSILDTSKVEAGKMQLEEVEFDMAQVLEESVDIFHVVALKKGVEVIWDPCDCSVLRFSNVKGDCKRLKQILDNLLGNAVKFTSNGHIVVRAWSKKLNLDFLKHSPKHGCNFLSIFNHVSKWLSKEDIYTDFGALNHIQHDPNAIEFIFEVDDTGMGIPKEKRASVFENYVQVSESTPGGQEGTGLGLGIVQSFVRIMGGDINIQDKEPSERGTCFRFNIFLKSQELCSNNIEETNPNSIQLSKQFHMQNSSTTNIEYIRDYSKIQSSVRAMVFEKGLKAEGIHSLLFIQGDETRRVIKKWMVNLRVKVWEVHHWEVLSPTLEKIKHNIMTSQNFDLTLPSVSLNKETSQNSIIYSEALSETDQTLPLTIKDLHKKTSSKILPAYILVIIDLSCENIPVICSALKDFAKTINSSQYKVVWLANSTTSSAELRSDKHVPCDLILPKPFHGSRLYEVLKLLQAFGEENEAHSSGMVVGNIIQGAQHFTEVGSSMANENSFFESLSHDESSNVPRQRPTLSYNENDDKPLCGMNILLVEDTPILRRLASTMLSRLGATVESCENGLEAVNKVKKALREATHAQDGSIKWQNEQFSYNVILMDCEMPVMDGYEATRHIRAEEQHYGHRIPIIALTAHATSEEEKKTILAGMDFHLTKPLKTDKLLEVIRMVCQN